MDLSWELGINIIFRVPLESEYLSKAPVRIRLKSRSAFCFSIPPTHLATPCRHVVALPRLLGGVPVSLSFGVTSGVQSSYVETRFESCA